MNLIVGMMGTGAMNDGKKTIVRDCPDAFQVEEIRAIRSACLEATWNQTRSQGVVTGKGKRRRVVIVQTRRVVLVSASLVASFYGAGSRTAPASDGNEPKPLVVRFETGERFTQAGTDFFGFSCEACNPNKTPLMFIGYRADAFDPPIKEPNISPIHTIQVRRDGRWQDHPQGWCGWGMDGIEIAAGQKKKFGFAVPADLAGKSMRVGIRWSRPLDYKTAEGDAFKIAWSEPFDVAKIEKKSNGAKP
jgi:hypothetical protein